MRYLGLFSLLLFLHLFCISAVIASEGQTVFYETFDKNTLDASKWATSKSNWYLQNGNFNFYSNAPYVWGNAALYGKNSVTLNPGRTYSAILRSSVFNSIGPYALFSPINFPSDHYNAIGTGFDGGGARNQHIYVLVPGATITYNNGAVEGNDYLVATTIRPSGSLHFVSGGDYRTFPQATLVWVNDKQASSSAYLGIDGKQISVAVPEVKLTDLTESFASQYGLAKFVDTFHREESTSLGNTESGDIAWASNNMKVSNNSLTRDNVSATASASLNSGVSEGIFELNFKTPEASSAVSYYFRQKDDNNWWKVRCEQSGITLQKSLDGILTTIYPKADSINIPVCQPNTDYRLVIRAHDSVISVWLNDVVVGADPIVVDAALLDETNVKIEIEGDNSSPAISKIAVWPKVITLPEVVGPFITVPNSGAATLIQDTFNDISGKRLKDHTPNFGGIWMEDTGNWVITDNKLTINKTTPYTIATIDSGKDDHAITMTVNLAGGSELVNDRGGWMVGPVIRYKDPSNYVWARFLWQGGSPEIEIFESVNGSGRFLNAKNITGLVDLGTTHTIKAATIGKKIAVYLDGKLILETESSFATGSRVGMTVDNLPGSPISTISEFLVQDTNKDTIPPAEVTDLTYSITAPNLYLNWIAPNDDASGVKFYRVYRSVSSGSLGTQINKDGETATVSYIDSSNPPTGKYYYTVRAVDAYGNENTSTFNKQITINYNYVHPGAGSGVQPPSPVNVLTNSSFETIGQFNGGFPANWQWQPSSWRDTSNAKTGTASIGIQGNGSNRYSYQTSQLVPNTKYILSGWIKTKNIVGNNSGISLRFVQDNPVISNSVVSQTQTLKGTNDWTYISTTFITPANHKSGRVDIIWMLTSTEFAWVDDVKLERITYPNLAINPSFEILGTGSTPKTIDSGTINYPKTWWFRVSATSDNSAHTGLKSLKLFGPANYTYSQQYITLKPSTYYRLSYWIKTQNVLGRGIQMRYAVLDPGNGGVFESPWSSGTANWRKIITGFKTPSVVTSGRLDILWQLNSGDIVWIDDVSLCERECI